MKKGESFSCYRLSGSPLCVLSESGHLRSLHVSLSERHTVLPPASEQTGKQQFRHGSVLRNQSREICFSGLIYFSGYIVQLPCGNLPFAHGQFQHLFREDRNLPLVQTDRFPRRMTDSCPNCRGRRATRSTDLYTDRFPPSDITRRFSRCMRSMSSFMFTSKLASQPSTVSNTSSVETFFLP